MARSVKYILVTGGVISSLGKGISAAAIGALLEARGLRVGFVKFDPYINVDPGTMNPLQHGEVFVTQDGAETDMDLGHYERFTRSVMGQLNNCTAGRIYDSVIKKERAGEYLGATVQVIPHVTNEIQDVLRAATQTCDVAIIEIGGTVGDIEGLPFFEAMRQFKASLPAGDVVNIHVTMVPYIHVADELKTKPTQHSVAALRQIGIQPEILLCRSERPLPDGIRDKLSLFCNVRKDCIFSSVDLSSVYKLPANFHAQGLDTRIATMLNIWSREPDLRAWERVQRKLDNPAHRVEIALVGKYVTLRESYKSLIEALVHAGIANDCHVALHFIDSEELEELDEASFVERLAFLDAIVVPGGFGSRGTEGKIRTIRYAREVKKPLLGICLGMQMAIVEFARHVCGMEGANSSEFDPQTPYPVIDLIAEQHEIEDLGGTMRLGAFVCEIERGTLAHAIYGKERIDERHRHRYEFNTRYAERLAEAGLVLSGMSPDKRFLEMCEIADHPWFLGCQFHPEYKSKPFDAHPIFKSFVAKALELAGDKEGA